jgi:hypothetical protein
VLFDPEGDEQIGKPGTQRGQAMQPGVATGADGNEQLAIVPARLTMMHMQPIGRAAGPAKAAVALQNLLPQAAETLPGVGSRAVAGAAEAGDERKIPARAQQRPRRACGVGGLLRIFG